MDEIDTAIVAFLKRDASSARALIDRLAANGMTISQPTLSRRLGSLIAARHVVVNGQGRRTVYEYDGYNDYFAVPPERRRPVGYDRTIVEMYDPNVTRWLSPDVVTKLIEAGGGRKIEASTYSKAISQKLLVDLSFASSNMEGNTYSYLDTQVLIEYGQVAEGKAAEETQMILNHKEAIAYLVEKVDEVVVDVREIKTMHALLARGLISDDAVGTVRRRIVGLGRSAYTPLAMPQMLEEEMGKIVDKAARVNDPFEQSLFLMTMISYLQFFEDVNKRTGRLTCNIPLLKAGLAPLSFIDMDKEKYTRGLLAFDDLGRPDIIAEAYVTGYLGSARRYDAYVGRDRSQLQIEVKRRRDIYPAVKAYVDASIVSGFKMSVEAFLEEIFSDDDDETRRALVDRTKSIIDNLSEGNHVAYGIPRRKFDDFDRLGWETVETVEAKFTTPGP